MATEADKVNTGALATIAAVLGLSVLGIALAVTALVRNEEETLVDNRSAGARRPYDELHSEQQGALQNGAVPIETAMANVVKGLQADPQSATPPSPADAAAPKETTDASAESADAGAEEVDGASEGEEGDGATPEKTDALAPGAAADAAVPKKKPKLKPPPPPPLDPTLPTPTGP